MRNVAILAVLAISFAVAGAPPPAKAAPSSYADPDLWLCRPGRADACSGALTATVITADGARTQRTLPAATAVPSIDCFYVYPTVSNEPTANSDRTVQPEETQVATYQFAAFGVQCRLFAPLYRQTTLAALQGKVQGADRALAYADVRDAWKSYLAHDNQGRGVVLIGHSQGAGLLTHLTAAEIDGQPVQRRLVSAILLGGRIMAPPGQLVGGTFKSIPLCDRADQAGCVVAYSTYLTPPGPGADGRFGGDGPDGQDACVNPAASLGRDTLRADFPAVGRLAEFGTTFLENPGQVLARCQRTDARNYLAISTTPGADVLAAELGLVQSRLPTWGLHVLDVDIALGDLVELVGRQSAAWRAAAP
jgi:hypothetical protein